MYILKDLNPNSAWRIELNKREKKIEINSCHFLIAKP